MPDLPTFTNGGVIILFIFVVLLTLALAALVSDARDES